MSSLLEEIKKVRADYCHGCKNQFTREEIMNGAQCESCKEAAELGRMVADLQD
jgi:rRNA maturation endonuclease Nob1